MVEISSFHLLETRVCFHNKKKKKRKEKTLFCVFFWGVHVCVLVSFNSVCSVFLVSCWQFSGAQKSQFFQSMRRPQDESVDLFQTVLKIEKIKISCDSRVLYLGWWCYTGGGWGESSTPKQCKAIWVLTKALKTNKNQYLIKYSWLEQWLKLLLQTDQWVCLGWGWKENTLVKQVAMAQLEVLFLGTG